MGMIKLIAIGVWACLVASGASYATGYWYAKHGKIAGTDESFDGLEYKKTKTINVPIIADGAVQGYIVAQFIYTIDSKIAKTLKVPPDAFILDEAFRAIYSDDKLDFKRLERFDIAGLTHNLLTRVAIRMKSDFVKDILVQEFNYVSKEDIRK